jgi:hypothetical protein
VKKSQIMLAAVFFAASVSLQAAGAVKTYLSEVAFAADEVVDWTGQSAAQPDGDSLQLPFAFSGATSTSGSVAVSVRTAPGRQPLPNPSSDGLLSASRDSGPITFTFTSGPVTGVGVRIHANGAGAFTGRIKAFDAAGNLLGTTTIAGTTTLGMADNASPFIGIRSNQKEIAKVEIEASGANGCAIGGLKLGLHPIIENAGVFVNQLFQDLYGRAPSTAELMANTNALNQGTSTRAQVAASLFQSAQFHDNAGFLVKCYTALLQRDSDFGQWSQILKLMQSGATQDSALAAFMGTPEYAAAYPEGLSDAAFVTKLYGTLLGRYPETGALESWASKFAQGTPRRDTVGKVLSSPEFEKRTAGRVNASLASLAFLRRAGEAAAIERWTGKLNNGASLTDLIGDFISLPEYVARF